MPFPWAERHLLWADDSDGAARAGDFGAQLHYAGPLGAFILRQSFASIPDSIIDAAMLDGCGIPRTLLWIAMPMNVSGLVCAFLLSFLDAWNMVEQPIAYLRNFERYPLSVALAYVPPTSMAIHLVCCILVVLPCLFLFAFFNRELVEGITLAEVK